MRPCRDQTSLSDDERSSFDDERPLLDWPSPCCDERSLLALRCESPWELLLEPRSPLSSLPPERPASRVCSSVPPRTLAPREEEEDDEDEPRDEREVELGEEMREDEPLDALMPSSEPLALLVPP